MNIFYRRVWTFWVRYTANGETAGKVDTNSANKCRSGCFLRMPVLITHYLMRLGVPVTVCTIRLILQKIFSEPAYTTYSKNKDGLKQLRAFNLLAISNDK
jgi:hypothetical protein